jgi:hypothetical protein
MQDMFIILAGAIFGFFLLCCSFNQLVNVRLDFWLECWYWTIRKIVVSILGLILGTVCFFSFVFFPDSQIIDADITWRNYVILMSLGFIGAIFAPKSISLS